VDYNSSVFDSNFLRSEYRNFLGSIGEVHGIAASIKASAGPFALVGEFVTALATTRFVDDAGRTIRIMPSAWQLSLGYQFDWNPWLEKVGDQGTFVAITYSGTTDMMGVIQDINGVPTRVGFLPERRLALTAGEWVLDGVKLAAEVFVNWDYAKTQGGTGNVVVGFITGLTLNY
jgi:hypothetical protein